MKIPYKDVEKLDSTYLARECLRVREDNNNTGRSDGRTDSVYGSSLSTISGVARPQYELYIPSPRALSRDEAFAFHLSTRNFFAYAVGRAVVGERLSSALAGLWQRLSTWAPKAASATEFTAYLERQGYSNFAENPEHALACLKFAENAKIRGLWINAFVHCAGMHERLFLSPEYAGLSNTTNALITRASLEMDLHIARVIRAVSTFLEEELGSEHLGLTKPARDHLDYFRSFVHSFYVDKLGYFPPPETQRWDKRPWKAMYRDFRCLYSYLVDTDSTYDMTSAKALTGGICVIQNVQSFDQRHGYDALPHPLPLLPQQPVKQQRKPSQKGLRSLALVSGLNAVPERRFTASQGMAMATNCLDDDVMQCQLVQQYQRFERQRLLSKLELSEARKVRWILIYSVLQMLTSIMKAPEDVRDVEDTSYPLCVLTGRCPPWTQTEEPVVPDVKPLMSASTTLVPDALDALEGRSSRISIHPDCEADSAEDFFASLSGSRTDSQPQLGMVTGPIRFSTHLARTASIRTSVHSSVQAIHKSVVGSLTRRTSLRRENPRLGLRKTASHCEIVVEDYGNGLNYTHHGLISQATEDHEEELQTQIDSSLQEFDFGLGGATAEPVLESQQVEHEDLLILDVSGIAVATSDDSDLSPRDSYASSGSGYPTSSNRSSIRDFDSPDTDLSSWDSSHGAESDSSTQTTPIDMMRQLTFDTSSTPCRYRRRQIKPKARPVSVNVGCYVPSGMATRIISKSVHRRTQSGQSSKSFASSLYPEESVQAADIEEVESRGRRKSRTYERDTTAYVL